MKLTQEEKNKLISAKDEAEWYSTCEEIKARRNGLYPNDLARETIKESTVVHTTDGNVNPGERGYVYDPNDLAKETIKETIIIIPLIIGILNLIIST